MQLGVKIYAGMGYFSVLYSNKFPKEKALWNKGVLPFFDITFSKKTSIRHDYL